MLSTLVNQRRQWVSCAYKVKHADMMTNETPSRLEILLGGNRSNRWRDYSLDFQGLVLDRGGGSMRKDASSLEVD